MSYKLVALAGPLKSQTFVLPRVATTIGADPMSDITWPDPQLASHHAIIRWEGDHFSLTDLHGASDTFLNGEAIRRATALNHGDQIRIGASTFLYIAIPQAQSGIHYGKGAGTQNKTEPAPQRERPLRLMLIVLLIAVAILAAFAIWVLPGLWDYLLPSAAPTHTPPPTGTATRPIMDRPTATLTPRSQYYPVPQLISPPQDAANSAFELQWSWQGALRVDEWYSVWVWQEGTSPRSVAWTKEPRYEVTQRLGAGVYNWQVVVVQGMTQGNWQRDLSAPSAVRRFTLQGYTPTVTTSYTPTPSMTPTATATPTVTQTPLPISQVIITGLVYDGQLGQAAGIVNAEVRIYLGSDRQTVYTDLRGMYRADFRLPGSGSNVPIDVLIVAAGYDPASEKAMLNSYEPGVVQQINLTTELFRSPTQTATWLPPTATWTPMATTVTPVP